MEITKNVGSFIILPKAKSKLLQPIKEEELVKLAEKELDYYDDLYDEIEYLWNNNTYFDMNNKMVRLYPDLDLILSNSEAVKVGVMNELSGLQESFQGFESQYLSPEEAYDIYFANEGQPNYQAVICGEMDSAGNYRPCYVTKKGEIVEIPQCQDDLSTEWEWLGMKKKFYEKEISDIKTARYAPAYHYDKKLGKLELLIKYYLEPKVLENKEMFRNLACMYHNRYIAFKNGKLALTKEGKEAIREKKLIQIGAKVLDIKNVQVEEDLTCNLLDYDNAGKKELFQYYMNCDKLRANLSGYDMKRLEDPNLGHWELWNVSGKNQVQLKVGQTIVARNPLADIRQDSVVGIDFGTKSTVVVFQDETDCIQTMRIGCGDIKREVEKRDFENPTVMQFINLEKFLSAYKNKAGRPYTKWDDLIISHAAQEGLKEVGVRSDEFYSYFYDLKQWAGNNEKITIRDKNKKDWRLPAYSDLDEKDFDPIEIYAYYIGLYINNMNNGIFMDYLLSFPVTYEKEIRTRILKSFEKGIQKSLPTEILDDKETMKSFHVSVGASEPAAYAICALEEYGFDPKPKEKVFYGIFDFGGGTTDFDFGIWTAPENEDIYDYKIQHFGSEGDRYLGGENLLEMLAYQVFCDNIATCRKNDLIFQKPCDDKIISVEVQGFVNNSQEAKMNTKLMIEKLRGFWERVDETEAYKEFYKEGITVNLFDRNGNPKMNILFEIDIDKLDKLLKERIEKGVKQFFNALKLAFGPKYISKTGDIDKINIFLAGNSSKSPILLEIFEKAIQEQSQKMINLGTEIFELYPPLGSKKAIEKQKQLGLKIDESTMAPNGKTGVAIGLIEGRSGGRIEIIDEVSENQDAKFLYNLGIDKKKKFYMKISRDNEYGKWMKFLPAYKNDFELYYTNLPEATTNQLSVLDEGVKRKRCHIDKLGEDLSIFVRFIKQNVLEYAVGDNDEDIDDDTIEEVVFS